MPHISNTAFSNFNGAAFQSPQLGALHGLDHLHLYKNITTLRHTVVLLMPDDKERHSIKEFLGFEGHEVAAFDKVSECEKWRSKNDFQVLLVQVDSISDESLIWFRNNKQLRNKGIVAISNQQDPMVRLISRKSGADNYLLKPVMHDEISAVIQNLMYRILNKEVSSWRVQTKEWLLISPQNIFIKLTFSEKTILERLAQSPGHVISKDDIAEALGYSPSVYDFRRLEIIIRRLRNKVQTSAGARLPLDTAHRKGYSFTADIGLLD
jgi:DNA-binding response OmpR family regulator